MFGAPCCEPRTWSTFSAVGSRTPRTGELRSSPSILFFATAPDFATLLLQLGNGLGWVGSVGLGFYCSGLHMEPSELLFSGVFFANFFNGVFGRGVEIFFLCSGAARFCPSPAAARPIRDSAREVEGKINSPDTRAPTPDRRQPVLSDTRAYFMPLCID